jgi:hypothetical protein
MTLCLYVWDTSKGALQTLILVRKKKEGNCSSLLASWRDQKLIKRALLQLDCLPALEAHFTAEIVIFRVVLMLF